MSLHLSKNLKLETILESENIAELLKDKDLEAIGEIVFSGYEMDKRSRKSWEDKLDEWTKLALQVAETKSFPWPNAANVKYPLITTAAMQFSARAYPALLPGTNPIRGRVVGFDIDGSKQERAYRVGKHMSYQILEEMEDWEEEMDRLLFALPILGCMFKKTYFNSVKGVNSSEVVYPKELVVNYWAKNLDEAERITHELKMSENDIYERTAQGLYIEQDFEESLELAVNSHQKITNESLGLSPPFEHDDTTPYLILEQCTYLDLDGDDYKEPYVVTIEAQSKKVLRIVPRFFRESIKYTEKGKILRISATNYYTKFSFIPSPDGGFYDIGFGVLLGPINETINTLINQLLDAGTLSNMQSGFIAKGIRIKGGNKTFTPGEWKFANSIGDDLRKGLVPLPVREPSQVLFSLLNMMIQAGDRLSSVTEVMSGEIPGQNTKATVTMAAIEQGMKVFSAIYKRIHRSLSKEYKKLFELNSMFLPEETYFNIIDMGQEGQEQIGFTDYAQGDIDVLPTSDPNVSTQEQKMQKVQAMAQLLQMGTINPQEYTKRFLEALETANMEVLMQMPEPQPNPEIELEKERFQDESSRAWEKLRIESTLAESTALKNIAEAESKEEGSQLDLYTQQMKAMQEDDMAGIKSQQAIEAHQQKMQQMQEQQAQQAEQSQMQQDQKMGQSDMQAQQKMMMQEQMHQQKLAQSQQSGANNGTGRTGNNR